MKSNLSQGRSWKKRLMAVLAMILVITMLVSFVMIYIVAAQGEGADAPEYEIAVEVLEDAEALHISQRLVYYNRTGRELDRVYFTVAPNLFRSESSLFYEGDTLEDAFSAGYTPGGAELLSIHADGEDADWGMANEAQTLLRVGCDIPDGGKCVFEFEYVVLTSANGTFLGMGEKGWWASGFVITACPVNDAGEPSVSVPLQGTRWMREDAANYTVTVTLPEHYELAATGDEERRDADGSSTWTVRAEGARGFSMAFSGVWRTLTGETAQGTRVNLYTGDRAGGKAALEDAINALERYEAWLGALPGGEIDILETDIAEEMVNAPGCVWIKTGTLGEGSGQSAIRRGIAQQFVGYAAYFEPDTYGWISDIVSGYLDLLVTEDEDGSDAMAARLNEEIAPYMGYTLPGNLYMTSSADTMTAAQYEVAVLKRGIYVMHELRIAMGREELLRGLAILCKTGQAGEPLTDDDFVAALNGADGGNWADFLNDWIYNIGEYAASGMDKYE